MEWLEERRVMAAGMLDTTFDADGVAYADFQAFDTARDVIVQNDGKVIAIGVTDNGVGGDFALARFNANGSLDAAFGTAGKVTTDVLGDDNVSQAALTSDGKIVVAGTSMVGAFRGFSVVKYNSDGTLDTSFSADGKVTTLLGVQNDAQALSIAVQTDGKIVVSGGYSDLAGSGFALVRYNANGSLDTSFDGDGILLTDFGFFANAVAVQGDGKIVAAGYGNDDFAMARFNPNGSYDLSFSSDGRVETDFDAGFDSANSIALQADGKIILAGVSQGGAGAPGVTRIAVARYFSDGSLDTAFDVDGRVTTSIGTKNDFARAVSVQSNGRIVVAGGYFDAIAVRFHSALVRYAANGSLDTTFDGDGIVVSSFSTTYDFVSGTAIAPDGSIVVAGGADVITGTDFFVARYLTEPLAQAPSDLDSSFGANGKTTTEFFNEPNSQDEFVTASAVQADGKVVVVGNDQVARFNADGTPDLDFGDSAVAKFSGTATSLLIRADGAIFVAGYRYLTNTNGTQTGLFVLSGYGPSGTTNVPGDVLTQRPMGEGERIENVFVELQADGKFILAGTVSGGGGEFRYSTVVMLRLVNIGLSLILDNTFGTQGTVRNSLSSQFARARSLALQPDGKIVIGGDVNRFEFANGSRDFAVARFNTNGTLDTSFDADGIATANFGTNFTDYANSMALQSDGKIIVAGYTDRATGTSVSDVSLARFNSNGTLDSSFDGDGLVTTNVLGGDAVNIANSVKLQSDGKIVVAGSGNTSLFVARYLSNGALDNSFDSDGLTGASPVFLFFNLNSRLYASSVVIQTDGKIMALGGYFNGQNLDYALARFNVNGTTDNSFRYFAPAGFSVTDLRFSQDIAGSIVIQPDGKTVVAGYISDGAQLDFGVSRYNVDGSLDITFGNFGKVITKVSFSDDVATSVALAPDGKIVVAGYTAIDATKVVSVVRYTASGLLDTTFDFDGIVTTALAGTNDFANSVVVQPDGKIVIGGTSNNSGVQRFALARFNTDGTFDSTFNNGGTLLTNFGDTIYSVKIQPDNKILAVGSNIFLGSGDFALARFNPNGSLDATFNSGGFVSFDSGFGADDSAFSAAIQADGKIVIAGYSFQDGARGFATARLNANGSLDTSFNGTGKQLLKIGTEDNYAATVGVQVDGKIVVGGFTRNFRNTDPASGDSNGALVRYNVNGSLDSTFGDGGIYLDIVAGMDNTYTALAIGSDGKIMVAGAMLRARYDTFRGLSVGTNQDFTLQRFVGTSVDIKAVSATTSGRNLITVSYNILGGTVTPFYIGTYLSTDTIASGYSSPDDSYLGARLISNPLDLSPGLHTLTFSIDDEVAGLPLPGAATAPGALLDRRLLVVFDDNDQIGELDASPFNEDNVINFQDVYHRAGGPVVAFGSEANDSMVVTAVGASLQLTVNARTFSYPRTDVSSFILLGATGHDTLNASNIVKPVVLIGGTGNDTLIGGTQVDQLQGNQGNDILNGGIGGDTLIGGTGNDTLSGDSGDDTLIGDGGNDTLIGGVGNDRYVFARVTGTPELDTVVELTNQGSDLLDFSTLSAVDAVIANLTIDATLALHTGRTIKTAVAGQALNFENLTGGAGNDTLRGNASINVLVGGAGNDILDGRDGADTLEGGAGNDSLTGGGGSDRYVFKAASGRVSEVDTIFELLGGGVDTLDFSALLASDPLNVNLAALGTTIASHKRRTINVGTNGGGQFLDNVTGGAGNDVITGNSAKNLLLGGGGNDTLDGGAGFDTLDGGDGVDTALNGEVLFNIP